MYEYRIFVFVCNEYVHLENYGASGCIARKTFQRSFGSAAVSGPVAGAAGGDTPNADAPAAPAAEAAPAAGAAPAPVEATAAAGRGKGGKPKT